MGCNCKKEQKLNNLDSKDHLQIVFDTYDSLVKDRESEEYDDAEKNVIINAYRAVYPNIRIELTFEAALNEVKNIYTRYYGRK